MAKQSLCNKKWQLIYVKNSVFKGQFHLGHGKGGQRADEKGHHRTGNGHQKAVEEVACEGHGRTANSGQQLGEVR